MVLYGAFCQREYLYSKFGKKSKKIENARDKSKDTLQNSFLCSGTNCFLILFSALFSA